MGDSEAQALAALKDAASLYTLSLDLYSGGILQRFRGRHWGHRRILSAAAPERDRVYSEAASFSAAPLSPRNFHKQ